METTGKDTKSLETALEEVYGGERRKSDLVRFALTELCFLCDDYKLDFVHLNEIAIGQYLFERLDAQRRWGQQE
jgi:hypothetical protein